MNNLSKHIIFIFLIGCIFLYHQCGNEKENDIKGKTRIAIVNPYPSYLKSFNELIEHKIIDIPLPPPAYHFVLRNLLACTRLAAKIHTTNHTVKHILLNTCMDTIHEKF